MTNLNTNWIKKIRRDENVYKHKVRSDQFSDIVCIKISIYIWKTSKLFKLKWSIEDSICWILLTPRPTQKKIEHPRYIVITVRGESPSKITWCTSSEITCYKLFKKSVVLYSCQKRNGAGKKEKKIIWKILENDLRIILALLS